MCKQLDDAEYHEVYYEEPSSVEERLHNLSSTFNDLTRGVIGINDQISEIARTIIEEVPVEDDSKLLE